MIKNTLPDTTLTLSDFHYDLPESYIAQTPVEPRDSSRLMIVDRNAAVGQVEHRIFRDIIEYLRPEDVLVVNDTRVIPARIVGHRTLRHVDSGEPVPTDSTAPVELLLLKQVENDVWETLAGPGKRAKPGDVLSFGEDLLLGHVESTGDGGCRIVRFTVREDCETVYDGRPRLCAHQRLRRAP